MKRTMIREPRAEDLDYFLEAGALHAAKLGLQFDADTYKQSLCRLLEDKSCKFFVIGGRAHCVIALMPSVYGGDLVAKVISVSGDGGIECFRAARRWAKASGATHMMADSYNPRLGRFYERLGMARQDSNYMGEL